MIEDPVGGVQSVSAVNVFERFDVVHENAAKVAPLPIPREDARAP
jgi:hypothetical protein